jgi:hypothetical protein
MRHATRLVILALCLASATACTATTSSRNGGSGNGTDRPAVTLASVEPGQFSSGRPGAPIPLTTLKSMDDRQVAATFGNPVFQRDDNGVVRLLRFRSDACDLDVFLYSSGGSWQVRHADARDRQLRTLPVDRCAGSVAAQKRS